MSGRQTPPSFNVLLAKPDEYVHADALADVAKLLTLALRSLGHNCRCQRNIFDPAAVNIILGAHLLPTPAGRETGRVIVYQFEQLTADVWDRWPGYMETLRGADAVWEFAAENLPVLADIGVSRNLHVPLGFHEAMETIPHRRAEVDVLFYGSLNARRQEVIAWLSKHCRVKTLFGVYGEERDEWIARARVVLNIHFYPLQVMEQPRISYLLNNGRLVVSEESAVNPFGEAIVTAPWASLGECCLEHLRQAERHEAIARDGYRLFRRRRMVDLLAAALEETKGVLEGRGDLAHATGPSVAKM